MSDHSGGTSLVLIKIILQQLESSGRYVPITEVQDSSPHPEAEVQVSHKGVQNQFPSFISALCGNCDTRPVGILTGSKSHQRLTFCLVYLKRSSRSSGRRRFLQKTCIFHYVVSGEGGKMRLPICRHCNLWWVMGNINEKCDPQRQGSANFIPT